VQSAPVPPRSSTPAASGEATPPAGEQVGEGNGVLAGRPLPPGGEEPAATES
jgi:hypothetical protein